MRAAALVASVVALVVLGATWKIAHDALYEQAKSDAAMKIAVAEGLLALREEQRLETLSRAGLELAAKNLFAGESRDKLPELIGGTTYGTVLKNSVVVDRNGNVLFAKGAAATGAVRFPALDAALGGAVQMGLLAQDEPALLAMKQEPQALPSIAVAAPIPGSDGVSVAGAIIVLEPLTPDFFHQFAALSGALMSLKTKSGRYGLVPDEASDPPKNTVTLVHTQQWPVFAQWSVFRVRTVAQSEIILAVDAKDYAKRNTTMNFVFIAAVFATVVLAFFAVRAAATPGA